MKKGLDTSSKENRSRRNGCRVVVAIPAYNEEKYIAGIVGRATEYADTVFVLNDGSTDKTSQEAERAGALAIEHRDNSGYGSAVQSILLLLRSSNFKVLVTIDADDQHDPTDIPKLVQAIENGYDLAIGCRAGKDVPFYRRVGGTILSVATYLVSGFWVRDSQCGFRAYSQRAVEMLRPTENGMGISSEITILAARSGLRITEVPISVKYAEDSSTHHPIKQGFYTLWRIQVIALRCHK